MSIVKTLRKFKFISPEKQLELYPPFLFMGVKIKVVTKDYRHIRVSLPLRWYGRNMYGTMFGGFMCAVSDPLPALLCQRVFKGHEVWTKTNFVDFLRPGKTTLHMNVKITEKDIAAIQAELNAKGKTIHRFEFDFLDKDERQIAHVVNEVFIRVKPEGQAAKVMAK